MTGQPPPSMPAEMPDLVQATRGMVEAINGRAPTAGAPVALGPFVELRVAATEEGLFCHATFAVVDAEDQPCGHTVVTWAAQKDAHATLVADAAARAAAALKPT